MPYKIMKFLTPHYMLLSLSDYDGMCRSLTEKERQLNELRERTDERLESLKREHAQECIRLEQDRAAALEDRDAAR